MNIEEDISEDISEGISEDISEIITETTPINYTNYRDKLKELKEKCADYKQAHSYCKSVHFTNDKIVKLTTLLLSSVTTYYISSHTEENLTSDDLDIDRKLTFATTIVSGINAIFNFSEKIEIHKSLNIDYLKLFNEIDQTINIIDEDRNIKEIYEGYHNRFIILNDRTTDIGLIRYAKNKFNIL